MQHAADYDYRGATPGAPKWPHTKTTVRHGVNIDPEANQIEEISVGDPGDDETYAVEINGQRVEFTTGTGADNDSLVNGLTDAINSEPLVSGYVEAEADTTADVITVTEREGAGAFTIVEVADPSSVLEISQTQAHAEADPIPFGRALLRNGFQGDQDTRRVKLPRAADLTARDIQVTLGGAADGDYSLRIQYDGMQLFVARHTAAADTEDDILTALRDDINNNGPNVLTATVDSGPNPSELHIVSETAGFADYHIDEADGPSHINVDVDAEGDDVRDILFGIAQRSDTMERTGENDAEYPPKSEVNVMSEGGIVVEVEDTPTADGRLWVRMAANGSNDQRGIFRQSYDSGAVPVPREILEAERTDSDNTVVAEIFQQ